MKCLAGADQTNTTILPRVPHRRAACEAGLRKKRQFQFANASNRSKILRMSPSLQICASLSVHQYNITSFPGRQYGASHGHCCPGLKSREWRHFGPTGIFERGFMFSQVGFSSSWSLHFFTISIMTQPMEELEWEAKPPVANARNQLSCNLCRRRK